MTNQPTLNVEYAIRSYRYLRLTIVIMVVVAIVAVLIEERVVGDDCWLRSFSAYFYTPVHSVFIGALVAIGACLIAVKGTDPLEDACLNIAGILAPVVAFVPTNRPELSCGSTLLVPDDFTSDATRPFVINSIVTYAIVGLAVVGLAFLIADRDKVGDKLKEMKNKGLRNEQVIGLLVALGVTVFLIVWLAYFRRSFFENAHDKTAIAMFIAIAVAALTRALRAASPRYRPWYWLAVVIMASAAVPFVWGITSDGFQHEVIWIEMIELVGFCAFWIVQSVEHWHLKITCPPEHSHQEVLAGSGS